MKVLPLLLTVSLAANAAWLTVTWYSSSAAAPAIGQTNAARPSGASSDASSGANGETRLSPAAAAIFADDNPEAPRDLLRASGLSEELVRVAAVLLSLPPISARPSWISSRITRT
jgi:hypothetical protein